MCEYSDVELSINSLLEWIEEEFHSEIKEMRWGGYRNDLLNFTLEDEGLTKNLCDSAGSLYYDEEGMLRGKYTECKDKSVKCLYEKRNQGTKVVFCEISGCRNYYRLRVRMPAPF